MDSVVIVVPYNIDLANFADTLHHEECDVY